MRYRSIMLAIVPNDDPNAEAQWITLDAALPACVTYLQERLHGDVPTEELPERWRRTEVIFSPHIPAGHHLVRVDRVSLPPAVLREIPEAQISAAIADAIEAWKNARQLPYLSPSACKLLNQLIVAGLRPLLPKG